MIHMIQVHECKGTGFVKRFAWVTAPVEAGREIIEQVEAIMLSGKWLIRQRVFDGFEPCPICNAGEIETTVTE